MTCHFRGQNRLFHRLCRGTLTGRRLSRGAVPWALGVRVGHGSGLNRCPSAHVSPSALRREREPVLLWQRRGRQSESNALADAYKVAPLRSRADLIVEMVRRLLGPSAVVSDAGDHEPDGWVWRVAVAGPLCHEHLEARGRCRTVVTRPVRAARLHVRVLDVLPHGWYRQKASCRWREPRRPLVLVKQSSFARAFRVAFLAAASSFHQRQGDDCTIQQPCRRDQTAQESSSFGAPSDRTSPRRRSGRLACSE